MQYRKAIPRGRRPWNKMTSCSKIDSFSLREARSHDRTVTRKMRFLIAATLMLAVSGPALSQMAQPTIQSYDSDAAGVVAAQPANRPPEVAEPPSAYAQFIDPVNGLSGDDVVRFGLNHNGELAAARQMIVEAQGRLKQAGLRPNPTIEAGYQPAVTSPDNNINFGAELPLELGGRRAARIAVAQRELDVRTSEAADLERNLAAEIRMKYADALAATRNLKLVEELARLSRESHRLISARVDMGKSAPLDQNLVFVEVNRVEAMKLNLEGRAEMTMFELKKIAGMPYTERLRLRGDFSPGKQPVPIDEAINNALALRPDLRVAQAAESLALAQIEQARSEGSADAMLFAGYMRQNMGFGVRGVDRSGALAPVQDVFHYVGFGIKLVLPVRNKNEGNIEAAQAVLQAVRRRREFAQVVIKNEVAAAYARYQRANEALVLYRDRVRDQALRNLDVIQRTYVIGQRSLFDYVTEQRRYVDIETGYTDVLQEFFKSVVEVDRASASPIPSA